jgi:hypothetical protein
MVQLEAMNLRYARIFLVLTYQALVARAGLPTTHTLSAARRGVDLI